MPRSRSRNSYLPKYADYSAGEVEQFLREEQTNGFRMQQPLPEGCNFVIVSLPKAVMRSYRQQERAWLQAKQSQQ